LLQESGDTAGSRPRPDVIVRPAGEAVKTIRTYRDRDGDSVIAGYEIGPDRISIHFIAGDAYLYTYANAGRATVEELKRLARTGRGLHSYIVHGAGRSEAGSPT
jgi:hypothetical protein